MDQSKVIAVDFNRTLVSDGGPDPSRWGDPEPDAKWALDKLKESGFTICINSVVGDKQALADWLTRNQMPFDHINESPAQPEGSSNKLNAVAYIDDRAVPYRGDWQQSLSDLFASGILTKRHRKTRKSWEVCNAYCTCPNCREAGECEQCLQNLGAGAAKVDATERKRKAADTSVTGSDTDKGFRDWFDKLTTAGPVYIREGPVGYWYVHQGQGWTTGSPGAILDGPFTGPDGKRQALASAAKEVRDQRQHDPYVRLVAAGEPDVEKSRAGKERVSVRHPSGDPSRNRIVMGEEQTDGSFKADDGTVYPAGRWYRSRPSSSTEEEQDKSLGSLLDDPDFQVLVDLHKNGDDFGQAATDVRRVLAGKHDMSVDAVDAHAAIRKGGVRQKGALLASELDKMPDSHIRGLYAKYGDGSSHSRDDMIEELSNHRIVSVIYFGVPGKSKGYKEYAIWGVPPGASAETLLVAMPNGKPITDKAEAERLAQVLRDKHGCTKVRIQTLDGTMPNFVPGKSKAQGDYTQEIWVDSKDRSAAHQARWDLDLTLVTSGEVPGRPDRYMFRVTGNRAAVDEFKRRFMKMHQQKDAHYVKSQTVPARFLKWDDESNSADFVISTEEVDRDGDTLDMDGLDVSEYKGNPVVCLNHDTDDIAIGRADDPQTGELMIRKEDVDGKPALVSRVYFNMEDEKARRVANAVKGGFMRAASVSFDPVEDGTEKNRFGGSHYRKWKLIEWSVVTVPANAAAVRHVRAMCKSLGVKMIGKAEMGDRDAKVGSKVSVGGFQGGTFKEGVVTAALGYGNFRVKLDDGQQVTINSNQPWSVLSKSGFDDPDEMLPDEFRKDKDPASVEKASVGQKVTVHSPYGGKYHGDQAEVLAVHGDKVELRILSGPHNGDEILTSATGVKSKQFSRIQSFADGSFYLVGLDGKLTGPFRSRGEADTFWGQHDLSYKSKRKQRNGKTASASVSKLKGPGMPSDWRGWSEGNDTDPDGSVIYYEYINDDGDYIWLGDNGEVQSGSVSPPANRWKGRKPGKGKMKRKFYVNRAWPKKGIVLKADLPGGEVDEEIAEYLDDNGVTDMTVADEAPPVEEYAEVVEGEDKGFLQPGHAGVKLGVQPRGAGFMLVDQDGDESRETFPTADAARAAAPQYGSLKAGDGEEEKTLSKASMSDIQEGTRVRNRNTGQKGTVTQVSGDTLLIQWDNDQIQRMSQATAMAVLQVGKSNGGAGLSKSDDEVVEAIAEKYNSKMDDDQLDKLMDEEQVPEAKRYRLAKRIKSFQSKTGFKALDKWIKAIEDDLSEVEQQDVLGAAEKALKLLRSAKAKAYPEALQVAEKAEEIMEKGSGDFYIMNGKLAWNGRDWVDAASANDDDIAYGSREAAKKETSAVEPNGPGRIVSQAQAIAMAGKSKADEDDAIEEAMEAEEVPEEKRWQIKRMVKSILFEKRFSKAEGRMDDAWAVYDNGKIVSTTNSEQAAKDEADRLNGMEGHDAEARKNPNAAIKSKRLSKADEDCVTGLEEEMKSMSDGSDLPKHLKGTVAGWAQKLANLKRKAEGPAPETMDLPDEDKALIKNMEEEAEKMRKSWKELSMTMFGN